MTTGTPHNFEAGKAGFAARLFRLRFHVLGLTQADFADRYGLSVGMVRDLEQDRAKPTRAVLLYTGAIERFPHEMTVVADAERAAIGHATRVSRRFNMN